MNLFRISVVLLALAVVLYLLAQLRARRIRERYVWLWLILLLGLVILAVFPDVTTWVARFFGFQLASNLVLTAAAVVTFLVRVRLSTALSSLQMSVRTLTEEIAFLKCELDEFTARLAKDSDASTPADHPTCPE